VDGIAAGATDADDGDARLKRRLDRRLRYTDIDRHLKPPNSFFVATVGRLSRVLLSPSVFSYFWIAPFRVKTGTSPFGRVPSVHSSSEVLPQPLADPAQVPLLVGGFHGCKVWFCDVLAQA